MKKFMLASVLSIFSATSVYADNEQFFVERVGGWHISGHTGNDKLNPNCAARFNYSDGSEFQLVKDIEDDELYIYFQNLDWNISDPVGSDLHIRVNFIDSRGNATGNWFIGKLLSKNSIHIRGIVGDKFVPEFSKNARMQLVMPGNIQNTTITLSSSTATINKMISCWVIGKDLMAAKKNTLTKGLPL